MVEQETLRITQGATDLEYNSSPFSPKVFSFEQKQAEKSNICILCAKVPLIGRQNFSMSCSSS